MELSLSDFESRSILVIQRKIQFMSLQELRSFLNSAIQILFFYADPLSYQKTDEVTYGVTNFVEADYGLKARTLLYDINHAKPPRMNSYEIRQLDETNRVYRLKKRRIKKRSAFINR